MAENSMKSIFNRKEFLGLMAASGAGLLAGPLAGATPRSVPPYLRDYSALYQTDPRAAALKWFEEAKFGLFMHYGLYSQLGRGEWVMLRENIPLTHYEELTKTLILPDLAQTISLTARSTQG